MKLEKLRIAKSRAPPGPWGTTGSCGKPIRLRRLTSETRGLIAPPQSVKVFHRWTGQARWVVLQAPQSTSKKWIVPMRTPKFRSHWRKQKAKTNQLLTQRNNKIILPPANQGWPNYISLSGVCQPVTSYKAPPLRRMRHNRWISLRCHRLPHNLHNNSLSISQHEENPPNVATRAFFGRCSTMRSAAYLSFRSSWFL